MKTKLIFLLISFTFLSCKTYYITSESLKIQFTQSANIQTEAEINNPLLYGNIKYKANGIKVLTVNDKKGNKIEIPNSPSLEMRVTHTNGKRYLFYFDTVILENDTLKGNQSRFLQSLMNKIPLNKISKIELQEGGKDFKYQE